RNPQVTDDLTELQGCIHAFSKGSPLGQTCYEVTFRRILANKIIRLPPQTPPEPVPDGPPPLTKGYRDVEIPAVNESASILLSAALHSSWCTHPPGADS